jgi:multidrug efflux pump subunit AcrA (membrane-fusion protein)
MKAKALFQFGIFTLLLAACANGAKIPAALPTVNLGDIVSTPVPNSSTGGGVTASGVVVANQLAQIAFKLAGNIKLISVAVGDQVQAGQVLVQLDDTTQQIQLEQANLALQELSSPSAIANAQLAVTSAQTNVINAQAVLNNQQYWKNEPLIQDYYAAYVIAKANLDKAQTKYDNAHVGDYINNADEATLYQSLYNAKQAYDTAHYYYSLYSQPPTQRQLNEAQASLALAQAKVVEAQNLVEALTGGSLPDNPSGTGYAELMQAKLAVQSAQASLDATRLVAPFAGEVASISVSNGDYIAPGQVILVISDVNHLHVETTDLSERDVPKVKLGQTVTISIKALNLDVSGKVTAISPLADSLGGDVVYRVTIALENLPPTLRAGMTADVQINTNQ